MDACLLLNIDLWLLYNHHIFAHFHRASLLPQWVPPTQSIQLSPAPVAGLIYLAPFQLAHAVHIVLNEVFKT